MGDFERFGQLPAPGPGLLAADAAIFVEERQGRAGPIYTHWTKRVLVNHGRWCIRIIYEGLVPVETLDPPAVALLLQDGSVATSTRRWPSMEAFTQETGIDQASPFNAFLRDCCIVRPGLRVPKNALWDCHIKYAGFYGLKPLVSPRGRSECLQHATKGMVQTMRPRVEGKQIPHYSGIGLSGWEPGAEDLEATDDGF
jgi:hypothetical protein